ncbi:MAG: CBS domain-containing protein, partial [Merdibacter sp.]
MFVRENMTKDPVCITPESTITQVVDLMSEKGLHRLPVVNGKRIVGLVTEGVISSSGASKATSLSIYELNYLLSKTTVDTVMIKNVITINENALMEEAAMMMLKNDIGCLPVVNDNGEISGILTQN